MHDMVLINGRVLKYVPECFEVLRSATVPFVFIKERHSSTNFEALWSVFQNAPSKTADSNDYDHIIRMLYKS